MVELLDRPSVLHKPVRQVVEHGGMSRQLPGSTKIVGVPGNPTPKMPGPDPVDHDPGGQGVFLVHNPLGKGQPALAFACGEWTRVHSSKGFGGAQATGTHRIPLGIDATSVINNIRIKITLCPRIIRYVQSTLNISHNYGLPRKNSMRKRLYPIEFDTVTDQVFKNARLGGFVSWIQTVVPDLGISTLHLFQLVDLLLKFLFLFFV